MELKVKPGFQARFTKILGGPGFAEFMDYNSRYLRRSIRVNTLKISVAKLKARLKAEWELAAVPWCKQGFFIGHRAGLRRDIGNIPDYQLGYFYVQEAASMIPPIVLDPKPGELVLDMAASPGSKTTQIAALMKNKGLIVANDINGKRMAALGINLRRCGVQNAVATCMKGHRIKTQQFERVLLDAPCSGTGAIRKSFKTLQIWNPGSIKRLAAMQRLLIRSAYAVLRPGGTLVYSTCSVEPEENEAVVDFLLKEEKGAQLLDIKLPLNRSSAVQEFERQRYSEEVSKCLRLWPQDNDTEGFFVAKVQKKS
jgi:tRNA (cytosine49-C5)-methyltransferase